MGHIDMNKSPYGYGMVVGWNMVCVRYSLYN